ncbi:hypothetical protein KW784_01545 [Candidatus Parcubacteria bacterium]|nr:hypothetical protein [Candidatus Parcubacteria bacterium]
MPALSGPTVSAPVVETKPLIHEVRSEDYEPITDPKNVEKFLKDYFSDIPLLARIGACESHNRQYNSKGGVLRGEKNSYDRGVMQINLLYHEETADKMGLDLTKIDDNVAFARYLYEKYGAKPWMSSSPCWSKFASPDLAKK